jgi:transcriptional antiterminator NusG
VNRLLDSWESPGRKVRILSGPFRDFSAVTGKVDLQKETAIVLISFFGKETPVEVRLNQVERL